MARRLDPACLLNPVVDSMLLHHVDSLPWSNGDFIRPCVFQWWFSFLFQVGHQKWFGNCQDISLTDQYFVNF